jgi:hypothetical protein
VVLQALSRIQQTETAKERVWKIQNGMESTPNRSEKAAVWRFLTVEMAGVVAEEEPAHPVRNPAVAALEEHRALMRARLSQSTQYRSTEHIFNTTNIVERLFSRAKLIMTDQRKCMSPRRLELLLFLRCNFHLWNVDTIQDLIDHQIVLATDDAGDGSDDEDSD